MAWVNRLSKEISELAKYHALNPEEVLHLTLTKLKKFYHLPSDSGLNRPDY